MKPTSRIRVGRLAGIFPFEVGKNQENTLHALIARLCVLFEDLRLEVLGIYDEPFLTRPEGQLFSKSARQTYFMRRSFGTLQEFSDVIVALDKCSRFNVVKATFDSQANAVWGDAVKHFKSVKHRLRGVRNDIGGHFTTDAALSAIEQLARAERGEFEDTGPSIDKIELHNRVSSSMGQENVLHIPLRLHFASHIAAAAILKNAAGSESPWVRAQKLLEALWGESHNHAYRAVVIIVDRYLWHRFGA